MNTAAGDSAFFRNKALGGVGGEGGRGGDGCGGGLYSSKGIVNVINNTVSKNEALSGRGGSGGPGGNCYESVTVALLGGEFSDRWRLVWFSRRIDGR